MEGWRDIALNETMQAFAFMQKELVNLLGVDVSIQDVRWAYLVLQSYGQWSEGSVSPALPAAALHNLELPSQVLFLWPLFLARHTSDSRHAASIRYDKAKQLYEIIAPSDMDAGEEVLLLDPRLSDATALCFRGLWLTSRHRAWLRLNVASAKRDPQSQPILQKYGCGAQPLGLFVNAEKTVDPLFLSCMRMLAMAYNASVLQRAERLGWMESWPETNAIDQRTEATAAELGVEVLEKALEPLGSSNAEIRQRFGSDTMARRPTVRVREAETMAIVGLLKSMRELALLSGHEYLFEALRDSQLELQRKAKVA
eukprot:TRINITY_DN2113_c1_g3_i1.p1 TRINITY_DN2113_c1_g3~~TRINITY_DN2113_c1_g3_i1.p1  ORF type:complete len:312 (+),score=46.89 TRINITY_DN2113_c1_g3_i1:1-936(+)